jgi:hypothetical protein
MRRALRLLAFRGLVCLAWLPGGALAADEQREMVAGFYAGTIGAALIPVTVSLRDSNGRLEGSYFYDRIGEDIPLSGSVSADAAVTMEEFGQPATLTGRWSGLFEPVPVEGEDGESWETLNRIHGEWRDSAGQRTMPFDVVSFEPLAASDLAFVPQRPGDPVHAVMNGEDGIAFQFAPVGRTGVQYPRLLRAAAAAVVAAVNAEIDALTRTFGCPAGAGDSSSFDADATVSYAARDIFSIYAEGGYFCGGAHPEDIFPALAFDLGTGRKLTFDSLFSDFARDRDRILAAAFSNGVTRGPECEALYAAENLRESTFTFAFARQGLVIVPVSWPHAVAACIDRTIVPYRRLLPFAAADGPLARAAN